MKSLPNNNEPLEVSINKQYYVIDAFYLTEIKSEFLKANILPKDIRNEVFPPAAQSVAAMQTSLTLHAQL
jgi:hypothetical protein